MGIKSQHFGRVILTDRDGDKFLSQVKYGRPKKAAVESVKRGVELSRQFMAANGKLKIKINLDKI